MNLPSMKAFPFHCPTLAFNFTIFMIIFLTERKCQNCKLHFKTLYTKCRSSFTPPVTSFIVKVQNRIKMEDCVGNKIGTICYIFD